PRIREIGRVARAARRRGAQQRRPTPRQVRERRRTRLHLPEERGVRGRDQPDARLVLVHAGRAHRHRIGWTRAQRPDPWSRPAPPGSPLGPGIPGDPTPGGPGSPFGPGAPAEPTAPNCARSSGTSFFLHVTRTTTAPDLF